jgi:hypothetical protein
LREFTYNLQAYDIDEFLREPRIVADVERLYLPRLRTGPIAGWMLLTKFG